MARNGFWLLKWREEYPTETEIQHFSMRYDEEASALPYLEKLKYGLGKVGVIDITNGRDHKLVHGTNVRDVELKYIEEEHIPTARELGLQGHDRMSIAEPKPHGSPILDPWGNDESF